MLSLFSIYFIAHCPPALVGTATILLFATLTLWMLNYWRLALDLSITYVVPRVLLLGIIARCLLLATDPYTTHDIERYLWDGAVVLNGLDPYVTAPNHPAIAELRAVWPTPEEHAAYPTLYPPIALALFAVSALAGPIHGVLVWKVLATLASIATLLLTANTLKRIKAESALPLIALSPLMLLEAGVGGHVDVFTSLSIATALWSLFRQKWLILGVALGVGTATKLLPLVLFAPLIIALPFRSCVRLLSGGVLSLVSCYGAALAAGLKPIGILGEFFTKWEFGSPIYELLKTSTAISNPSPILLILAIVAGASALWRSRTDVVAGMIAMLAIPLLLSPVVFPWYLLVLVPFLALQPNAFLLIWISVVPLSYEVLNGFIETEVWQPASWPLWCIASGWIIGTVLTRSTRTSIALKFR